MAFSDNAIGFWLEIENSTFSSTLASAEKDYDRFVKALTKHNKAAFESATKGLGRVEDLVEALAELPEKAATATRRAQGKIAKEMKPLAMKADLQLSARAKGTLKKAVREAVGEALAGTQIRLGASFPKRKLGMFNTELSLGTLYSGIPQPPDMKGKLQPRKFQEGGVVEGPQKGFDSVLALLQPGEMVLPKDVSEQLQELAGAALEGAEGEFVDPKELAKAFAEVENLARGMDKLKKIVDAGFADEEDLKMLDQGMEELKQRTFALDDSFNDLSFTTRVRLAPSIEQVHNRMGELIDKTNETSPVVDKLLTSILGPARFLAVNKAVSQVSESMGQLGRSASLTFDKIGGREIGDATDNLNKLNTRLGLSRSELFAFKTEIRDTFGVVRSGAVGFDQYTASLLAVQDAGVTDRKMLVELAETAALANEGFSISAESVAAFGFEARDSIGLARDQFRGLTATIGELGQRTNGFSTNAEESFTRVAGAAKTMGGFLREVSETDAQEALTSMARLDAALTSTFIDSEPIMQTLAAAMEGVPEAAQKMSVLTGESIDSLRQRMVEGDVEGLFDQISRTVAGMDPAGLNKLGEAFGLTSEQLKKFGDDQESLNELLARSDDFIVENADAAEVLTGQAENAKTTVQRWQTALGNFVATQSVAGVNLGELVDVTKEFNVATLLSIGYLGKFAATLGGGVLKGVKAVAGKLGSMTGLLRGGRGKKGIVGQVTGGVGGAAGKGGAVAGIFTGLSTGLTTLASAVGTLGAVLISPPGIAFTVSFVAALLALGGAARMAAPALEVMGKVVMHMIDGVVEVGKAFLALDPKRMLAAGPGLLAVGAGFSAVGVGLTAFGAGAGAASVGFGALALVTRATGGLRGNGISGVLEALIADLEPLAGMAPRLKAVNRSLGMVVDFLVEFAKVSAGLSVLGGAAVFQNLVGGFLDLIGVGSPLEHLAVRSAGVANTVETMLTNFQRLASFTPESLTGITTTLRTMIGFMGDYARLSEAIDELPGGGVFANIGDAIGGLFGADSPAEKLAEASGPIVDAMGRLLTRFSELQGFVQPRQVSAVPPSDIQQVVQATLDRDAGADFGDKLDMQTKIMEQMLAALREQVSQGRSRPEPSTRALRSSSRGSSFARDAARGDY